MSTLLVFTTFWGLTAFTYARVGPALLNRQAGWALDLSGLVVQGAVVPACQWGLAAFVWPKMAPTLHGVWSLSAPLAFALDFVAVDYLYYLNHRLLHGRTLWRFHAVHHTAQAMDVLVTGRNTIFTPLFIVYFWVNSALMYLLADPAPFVLAASLTAALDLWRHSTLAPKAGSAFHHALAAVLITPHEHAWHHSRDTHGLNYGANLSWWDKLHRSYRFGATAPTALGVEPRSALWRRLWLPEASP